MQFPVKLAWIGFIICILLSVTSFFISGFSLYRLAILSGVNLSVLFFFLGCLLTWYQDIRHEKGWYGKYYEKGDMVLATLISEPVEKSNSIKILARVNALCQAQSIIPTKGRIILYLEKASSLRQLGIGSKIIFSNPLQEITNPGNPGDFDFKRYSLFQGIVQRVFLKRDDFFVSPKKEKSFNQKVLAPIREKIIQILQRNIPGERERGLAEALLIGYKDDLDQDVVQSYTKTGVVHIIAISGLHLGLIYWLLVQLLMPLRKSRALKWVSPVCVVSGLWLFSLLAGGQPSVMRSAVMFTCVVLAESFSRKTSIFNSLAFSALILLCAHCYWLWDIGFQLSYAAVLSIVIFMRPVYNIVYIKNKALDLIWKLNSVSIAAQILTTPFSLYHFHQFPSLFLFSNLVAVPLSSIIVLGEIALCLFSSVQFFSNLAGRFLSFLISTMNGYIKQIESIPISNWSGMYINIPQGLLLFFIIAGLAHWLLHKRKTGLLVALGSLFFFSGIRSYSFYQSKRQGKIIIYNIPGSRVIDIIDGRICYSIAEDNYRAISIQGVYLRNSRILHRIKRVYNSGDQLWQENFFEYHSKKILLIDSVLGFTPARNRIQIDLLVVSKRPWSSLPKLAKTFKIKQIVFDGTVSGARLKYWIRECDSLCIPHHDVRQNGAFVLNFK